MFRKSDKTTQLDAFKYQGGVLVQRAAKIYDDPKHWHNQFRTKILANINEDIFHVLFHNDNGAPNASIRVLIGMMILKEAFGMSDSRMFEQACFNSLFRKALGLVHHDQMPPAESTYYLVRKKMHAYDQASGQSPLIEQVFDSLTANQIKAFSVDTSMVRMDSKFYSSNIAMYSRYELIVRSVVRVFKQFSYRLHLNPEHLAVLKVLAEKQTHTTVYTSTKQELTQELSQLGPIIDSVLRACATDLENPDESVGILREIFHQQYEKCEDGSYALKANDKITSGSVQSPDDADCAYRRKKGESYRGYATNISETCNPDNTVNLIVGQQTKPANAHDSGFVVEAIAHCQALSDTPIKEIYADGAFNSPDNDEALNTIDMVYTGLQGAIPRFELDYQTAQDTLVVTDSHSGKVYTATKARKNKARKTSPTAQPGPDSTRWWILAEDKKVYFGQSALDAAAKRQTMNGRSREQLHRRNNVEATIYRIGVYLRNKKSKYRGLLKQISWVSCRCIWVNFTRIMDYETRLILI